MRRRFSFVPVIGVFLVSALVAGCAGDIGSGRGRSTAWEDGLTSERFVVWSQSSPF